MLRRLTLLTALVVLGLGLSYAHAQQRLSAFDLVCIGQAKGQILVMATFANGTIRTFANSCTPTTHGLTAWPTIPDSQEDVASIEVITHVNRKGQLTLYNQCSSRSSNGYVSFSCLVDEAGIDEMRGFVSLPHSQ